MKIYKPSAHSDILKFCMLLESEFPFTFVRFSDGEVELLRNRKLFIDEKLAKNCTLN
jgi:hypothetical protein